MITAPALAFDSAIRAELQSRVGGWIERRQEIAGPVEVYEVADPANGADTILVRVQPTGIEITSAARLIQVVIGATTHPDTAVAVLAAALGEAGR